MFQANASRQLAVVSKQFAFSKANWKLKFEKLKCRVVKLADTPPCLGGRGNGKSGNGTTTLWRFDSFPYSNLQLTVQSSQSPDWKLKTADWKLNNVGWWNWQTHLLVSVVGIMGQTQFMGWPQINFWTVANYPLKVRLLPQQPFL